MKGELAESMRVLAPRHFLSKGRLVLWVSGQDVRSEKGFHGVNSPVQRDSLSTPRAPRIALCSLF